MQGFTYTTEDIEEIAMNYNTGQETIPAAPSGPAFQVIGGFEATLSTSARLQVTGLVSTALLAMTVRVYHVTEPGVLGSSVTIASTDVTTVTQATTIDLIGGHEYQIQAQVLSGNSETEFGVVHTATMI